MNLQQVIYLLSIMFQLSGSLILIFYCWGKTEHKVLNSIFSANASVERNDDNKVKICKEKLYRAYKKVWLNRTAFMFLGFGYSISIFGDSEGLILWIGFLIVVLGSIAMMWIGNKIVDLITKKNNKIDCEYDYEELCSNIDTDVPANIINPEIDNIMHQ